MTTEEFYSEPGYQRLAVGDILTADTEFLTHVGGVLLVGVRARSYVGSPVRTYTRPCRRPSTRNTLHVSSRPPAHVRMANGYRHYVGHVYTSSGFTRMRRPGQRPPPPITSNRPPAHVRKANVSPLNLP